MSSYYDLMGVCPSLVLLLELSVVVVVVVAIAALVVAAVAVDCCGCRLRGVVLLSLVLFHWSGVSRLSWSSSFVVVVYVYVVKTCVLPEVLSASEIVVLPNVTILKWCCFSCFCFTRFCCSSNSEGERVSD